MQDYKKLSIDFTKIKIRSLSGDQLHSMLFARQYTKEQEAQERERPQLLRLFLGSRKPTCKSHDVILKEIDDELWNNQ